MRPEQRVDLKSFINDNYLVRPKNLVGIASFKNYLIPKSSTKDVNWMLNNKQTPS